MTRSSDLLDRVAAANPVPTEAPPTPAQRDEADALLARVLDTPLPAAEPPPPRRRRTRSLALSGVFACAVVALLVTSLLDRGPSITERAYATVSQPSLYHVVTRTTFDVPAALRKADLGLPRRDLISESWYDLERPAYHVVQYELRDGRRSVLLEGTSADGTRIRGFDGPKASAVQDLDTGRSPAAVRFDPTAQFKAAYREGNVREQGTVTVAGRRAHRLVIEHDPQPVDPQLAIRSSRTIALFDAKTNEPIEFIDESVIEANGRRGSVVVHTHYATFEKLPRTPENLAKLQMTKRP